MSLNALRQLETAKIETIREAAERTAAIVRAKIDSVVSDRFAQLSEDDKTIRSQPIVYARVKSQRSAMKRIEERYGRLEDVPDYIGCRVVVTHIGEVEEAKHVLADYVERIAAKTIEHTNGRGRSRGYSGTYYSKIPVGDWIRNNADVSHLEIPAVLERCKLEIQVHTAMEEAWSRLSHAGFYKSGGGVPQKVHEQLVRMAAVSRLIDEELERISVELPAAQKRLRDQFLDPEKRAMLAIDEHVLAAAPLWNDRLRRMFDQLRVIGESAGLSQSGWEELVRIGDETDICIEVCQRTGIRTFREFEENINTMLQSRERSIDALRETFYTHDDERRGALAFDRPLTVFALLKLLQSTYIPSIDTMYRALWNLVVTSTGRVSKGYPNETS